MRKKINRAAILFCILFVGLNAGCKKFENGEEPVDYDIKNKIFRVHTTTDLNTPYSITITQQNSGTINNVIDVKQNNGGDFNYGFTPQLGSTVIVKVQAEKTINCYVFYNGENFGSIEMKPVAGGKFEGELTKTINK
nr:hypothetical protein [Mucilaginibacter sp. L294]